MTWATGWQADKQPRNYNTPSLGRIITSSDLTLKLVQGPSEDHLPERLSGSSGCGLLNE